MMPIFLLFVGLLILNGCGQLSTLQTAKPLAPGEITLGGALIGFGVQDGNTTGGNVGNGIFPHAEFMARFGLVERLDMGLKLSTGGNLLVDGKYQFVGDQDSRFAMGIGGGFEYQGSDPTENFIFRTHLPLYLSYHPSETDAIYAAPRFVWQFVSDDDDSYFFGGGLGYNHRFSDKFAGMIESSLFAPRTQNTNNNGAIVFQFGLGVAFHIR